MIESAAVSRGVVQFCEFPAYIAGDLRELLALPHSAEDVEAFTQRHGRAFIKSNMFFNFPRLQYALLDRGETPESINANWFTLSNAVLNNPALITVPGETMRLAPTTKAVDPVNPKNTIFRFVLDVGQFVGSFKTAVLIGGADATSAAGTGKIVSAVNDLKDDSNIPLNRDGTTIHLVNWKLKHMDSSEI